MPCLSQNKDTVSPVMYLPRGLFKAILVLKTDSGTYITQYTKAGCKNYNGYTRFYPAAMAQVMEKIIPVAIAKPIVPKVKLLTIHGNVYYDFFYRSAMDTPVNQKNFQQHTERINLQVMIKEKYPVKLSFTARQSNSPYFRNFFDPNFQFDRFNYARNLRQKLTSKLNAQLPKLPDLQQAEAALQEELNRYAALKKKLDGPRGLQQMVEDKEKGMSTRKANADVAHVSSLLNRDSLLPGKRDKQDSLLVKAQAVPGQFDSAKQQYTSLYQKERSKIDSIAQKVNMLQKRVDSLKNSVQQKMAMAKQQINKATSQKELMKIAAQYGIQTDEQGKLEKHLASVKNFSIGRGILDYTELTAQHITITGVNIEYNSSYYAAIAVGKIDYRFRDFYNKRSANNRQNNQYIVMGRLGIGDKEKKALIFSLFQGRKNTAEYSLSDTVKNYVNIMGYAVEAIYKKDEHSSLSAEFAKSTKPVSGGGNLQGNKQTAALWNYSDKTNMGINIKAQTHIPETNTRLSGFYRKTGQHFQSFSLFSYNTDQTAWLTRFDQSFLKNKISLTGMLRRNDFTNPFTDKTFKTSTVFKSVLLQVRFPKYPSLSLGYYPGTQLYLVNKELIRENAYYILNGSLVYSYFVKQTGMNTTVVYNRYTNQATDSGFVLYKGVNYYAAQTFFLRRLQLQGGYAYTKQPGLEFYTLEASGDYAFKKMLRISAGAKYNKISGGSNYWGERLQLTADLKRLGQLQLQYEKSYLPTIQQTLYPVETGRLTYYKYF